MHALIADMDNGGLMFDGAPMSGEARESIIAAMKLGLEVAKVRNKERFTPKKYKRKPRPMTCEEIPTAAIEADITTLKLAVRCLSDRLDKLEQKPE